MCTKSFHISTHENALSALLKVFTAVNFLWTISANVLLFSAATHCTELPYLFGKGIIHSFSPNASDLKMLDQFTTFFTNFAKCGWVNWFPGRKTVQIFLRFPVSSQVGCISSWSLSSVLEEFFSKNLMPSFLLRVQNIFVKPEIDYKRW